MIGSAHLFAKHIQRELDRLKQEFIDQVKCGRLEEARRTLHKRDALLLRI